MERGLVGHEEEEKARNCAKTLANTETSDEVGGRLPCG